MRGAIVAAVSLSLACNQSLFDSKVEGSKDAGAGDDEDAASDAAPVVSACPEPCRGDPVADFDMTQGGTNGRWFYLEDSRDSSGLQYPELQAGSVAGVPAWVSGTGGAAAIVNCAQNPGASVCAGVADHLVFIPSPNGAADTDPVLSYRVPNDGTYVFAGQLRSPDDLATSVAQRFLLVRNARHDLLHKQSFATSPGDETFSVTIEALAGDSISLTLLPNESGTPEPVAFKFFVSLVVDGPDAFPGACQFAATFDGATPLEDRCRGAAIENLNDAIGPPGESVDTLSASAQYDRARQFGEGQYLKSAGSPADYSGDFTVQFWVNLDEPQPSFGVAVYADWNDAARGGVNFGFSQDTSLMDACYIWDDPAVPTTSPAPGGCLRGSAPRDGEWHFYRVSRDAAGISLCIDGVLQATDTGPKSFDMTSDVSPHMGRNVTYNPAYFGGDLDDVRVFSRALPCPTSP